MNSIDLKNISKGCVLLIERLIMFSRAFLGMAITLGMKIYLFINGICTLLIFAHIISLIIHNRVWKLIQHSFMPENYTFNTLEIEFTFFFMCANIDWLRDIELLSILLLCAFMFRYIIVKMLLIYRTRQIDLFKFTGLRPSFDHYVLDVSGDSEQILGRQK